MGLSRASALSHARTARAHVFKLLGASPFPSCGELSFTVRSDSTDLKSNMDDDDAEYMQGSDDEVRTVSSGNEIKY